MKTLVLLIAIALMSEFSVVNAQSKSTTKIIVEHDVFNTLLVEYDTFYKTSAGSPIAPPSINVHYSVDVDGSGVLRIEAKDPSAAIGNISIGNESVLITLQNPAPTVCFIQNLTYVSMEFESVTYRWEIPMHLIYSNNYDIDFFRPTCTQYK